LNLFCYFVEISAFVKLKIITSVSQTNISTIFLMSG
jgi:hypothetical protein